MDSTPGSSPEGIRMLQTARTLADRRADPAGSRRGRVVHRLRWVNPYLRTPFRS